jgi:hypothetical protein
MKFFSDCDECVTCTSSGGGCLAGHGDDDWNCRPKSQLEEMVETKYHPGWKRELSEFEIKTIKNRISKL